MAKKPRNRLYIPSPLVTGASIELSDEQFNYLIKVLRLKTGYEVAVFNEAGEWLAHIGEIYKKSASITVSEKITEPRHCKPLTLLFAPVKHPNPSFYVQKATELGVTQIIPIITERTIVRSVNDDKLALIAIEASEQSERFEIPTVSHSIQLMEAIHSIACDRILFCDEAEQSRSLLSEITEHQFSHDAILIGPEGGFSEEERAALKANPKVVAVSISKNILRAETAMITALGVYGVA